jgi:serine O-acetyltransferase
VAAGAVVLADVPANATVAGVPAKILKTAEAAEVAREFFSPEGHLADSFDFSI